MRIEVLAKTPCFVGILLLSAAAQAQIPNPILEPEQPWAFDGFVIHPPREGNWFSLTKTRTQVVFAQSFRSTSQAIVARVASENNAQIFPTKRAFLEYMRARRAQDLDAGRYRLVGHREEPERDEDHWCTHYRLFGEERGQQIWFIEVIGRSCWHAAARQIVDASVTERSAGDRLQPPLEKTAEPFLSRLRLTPVTSNAHSSVDELMQSARRGDTRAALRLGLIYDQAIGRTADPVAAERWYRLAAEAGEADALYNLGVLYEQGRLGEPDIVQALQWFRRAADQRDPQAQLNLGILYYRSTGAQRDLAQARQWLEIAAANGSARAKTLLEELPLDDSEPSSAASIEAIPEKSAE